MDPAHRGGRLVSVERGGYLMPGGHSRDVACEVTAFLAGQDEP